MFSGPPDQPLLNIEAIRNPESTEDDVTAGVRVTGRQMRRSWKCSPIRPNRSRKPCLICCAAVA